MAEKLLEIKRLRKYFKTKSGMLHAVDDVDFDIAKGETLGLVGESGCGKSTTGRVILRLHEPTSGEMRYRGENIMAYSPREMKSMRRKMQIVFQDPYSSLNPRLTVSQIIAEPLYVNKVFRARRETEGRVDEVMELVGLERRLRDSYPHELDGGRRQRIGIARAISVSPEFIVLDEPVSALDVCIQAQILNLMNQLQQKLGLTYLFISHNLSVVKHVSDRIAVMYLGKIVELSDYRSIFTSPLHPYTQALLSAIPIPRIDRKRDRIILEGDVPSPIEPPNNCRFYGRCRCRKDICKEKSPELRSIGEGHYVACHAC
jgi:oligopeptide/dipeptide ABC transporter ATP-binding protein